jgi:ABC-2 type transport system permease protein
VASGRLRAYARLFLAQARSQAQYRTSFALDVASSVGLGLLDLVLVIVLFRVSRTIAGFTFPEVFLMTALANCAFATADLLVGNVERLRVYVRTGQLDTALVRPLGTLPQLMALDLALRRVGALAVGITALVIGARQSGLAPTPGHVALLVVTPLAGSVILAAVFVGTASVAFWWIESGEIGNALTYGGRDFSQYPVGIYAPAFRRLIAYGLGFAFVAYYPTLALIGRADPLGAPVALGYLSPLVAILAAVVAGWLWRRGVRHYNGTGS